MSPKDPDIRLNRETLVIAGDSLYHGLAESPATPRSVEMDSHVAQYGGPKTFRKLSNSSSIISEIFRHPDASEDRLRTKIKKANERDNTKDLIDFLRNTPPPPGHFMSIPDACDGISKKKNNKKKRRLRPLCAFFRNMILAKGAKKSKQPPRQPEQPPQPPLIRLPDSAVAGRSIGGYRHIAISIPIEYDHLDDIYHRPPTPQRGEMRGATVKPNPDRPLVTVLKPVVETQEYLEGPPQLSLSPPVIPPVRFTSLSTPEETLEEIIPDASTQSACPTPGIHEYATGGATESQEEPLSHANTFSGPVRQQSVPRRNEKDVEADEQHSTTSSVYHLESYRGVDSCSTREEASRLDPPLCCTPIMTVADVKPSSPKESPNGSLDKRRSFVGGYDPIFPFLWRKASSTITSQASPENTPTKKPQQSEQEASPLEHSPPSMSERTVNGTRHSLTRDDSLRRRTTERPRSRQISNTCRDGGLGEARHNETHNQDGGDMNILLERLERLESNNEMLLNAVVPMFEKISKRLTREYPSGDASSQDELSGLGDNDDHLAADQFEPDDRDHNHDPRFCHLETLESLESLHTTTGTDWATARYHRRGHSMPMDESIHSTSLEPRRYSYNSSLLSTDTRWDELRQDARLVNAGHGMGVAIDRLPSRRGGEFEYRHPHARVVAPPIPNAYVRGGEEGDYAGGHEESRFSSSTTTSGGRNRESGGSSWRHHDLFDEEEEEEDVLTPRNEWDTLEPLMRGLVEETRAVGLLGVVGEGEEREEREGRNTLREEEEVQG
ncbi:hypothetical protein B0T19DRAFT_407144 [Cercophora scortea]|uniref:Uncharacterized protein n=1 Tax=Cercophora scortea TaxID=314031 RepID=A0AAE0MLQ6_9PEZI|nr:hypothetical protein B0T19DRAFT_407144 [Cercophora scortea]